MTQFDMILETALNVCLSYCQCGNSKAFTMFSIQERQVGQPFLYRTE